VGGRPLNEVLDAGDQVALSGLSMLKLVSSCFGVFALLVGCASAPVPQAAPRSDIALCDAILSKQKPESRLAFYGPSGYRDRPDLPPMSVSMSSDDVIASILKICPHPLNVSKFDIKLFREQPVFSRKEFFREQEYVVTSNEFYSIHSYCYVSISVWFRPDGTIYGIFNGGELC
jgi:hypothetical protein